MTTKNTAQNVIFILLAGAPSHTDTFDLKVASGTTPGDLHKPETVNGMLWPTGLLPKLGQPDGQLRHRPLHAGARAGALAGPDLDADRTQSRRPRWAISRPISAASWPSEKFPQRKPSDIFPTFLALNSAGGVNQGYFSAKYAPFKVIPATSGHQPTPPTPSDGQTRFKSRFKLINSLDATLRTNSPYGPPMSDYNDFYIAANRVDVQPDGQSGFRLHQLRIACATAPRARAMPAGGFAGSEGQPGHALHPDHQQRWLGHARQYLRRRQPARENQNHRRRCFRR